MKKSNWPQQKNFKKKQIGNCCGFGCATKSEGFRGFTGGANGSKKAGFLWGFAVVNHN